MGYIKHDAIIVTGFDLSEIMAAKDKAESFFREYFDNETINQDSEGITSNIVRGLANDQYSFFIGPDGSKEGWTTSDLADQARAAFMLWANTISGIEYIHIRFGGDDSDNSLEKQKDKFLCKP